MKSFKILVVLSFLVFTALYAKSEPKTVIIPETESEPTKKKAKTIKVALLLDTSSSMDGLINQAKAQLWEIVNELSKAKSENIKPDLKIALYEYGNDNLTATSGYIRKVTHFSGDLDVISEKLFALKTNGGNEYCGQVIQTSLDQLEWGKNKGDLKIVFIAGNEPFTQGKVDFRGAITNAREKGIVVNTIFCGDYDTGITTMWKDAAIKGAGDYMNINHNKKIVHIPTPYDDQIIILNKKLNGTYIYFGQKGKERKAMQQVQDSNAISMNKSASISRAVSKSSRAYSNVSWDLVDAEEESESFSYEKVDKKTLPKELQGKTKEQIKAYVTKKKKERDAIQKEINSLNVKRRKHIDKKSKKSKSSELETVIIRSIKKQAKKKKYTW